MNNPVRFAEYKYLYITHAVHHRSISSTLHARTRFVQRGPNRDIRCVKSKSLWVDCKLDDSLWLFPPSWPALWQSMASNFHQADLRHHDCFDTGSSFTPLEQSTD